MLLTGVSFLFGCKRWVAGVWTITGGAVVASSSDLWHGDFASAAVSLGLGTAFGTLFALEARFTRRGWSRWWLCVTTAEVVLAGYFLGSMTALVSTSHVDRLAPQVATHQLNDPAALDCIAAAGVDIRSLARVFPGPDPPPPSEEPRVRVISFWASWCAPCVRDFARLRELEELSKGQLQVTLINVEANLSVEEQQDFLRRHGAGRFASYADPNGAQTWTAVSRCIGRDALPTAVVHDREGVPILYRQGLLHVDELFPALGL